MSFGEHVSWLGRLSSKDGFNAEKKKFIKFFSQGTYEVDRERGIVEGTRINSKTHDAESYNHNFDNYILTRTKGLIRNPITKIIEPIAHKNIDAQIEAWLNILKRTKSHVDDNDYFDSFPNYKKSIFISIKALQEHKDFDSMNLGSYRGKKQKAYELEPYLVNIKNAGSHEEALTQIKKDFPDFRWDRPRRKLFKTTRSGIIQIQVSHALELIAKIKWPESYPSTETIRATLLK